MRFHRTIVAVGLCLFALGVAFAQVESTRVSQFDWQCQDANGARVSDHVRFDTAFVACLNAPNGAYVQGGRYRITRPTAPQPATGSAALSWSHDGLNTAGFRVSYGTSSTALTQVVQIAGTSIRAYTISSLSPGTYYFAVKAYSSDGSESNPSNVVSKVVL